MASASSSYYISFVFALLCVCVRLCAGAFLLHLSEATNPFIDPSTSEAKPNIEIPPAPSPTYTHTYSPAATPTPTPAHGPAPAPVPTPHGFLKPAESAKHKRGRILGLVLISVAGALQAFVVLFLFIKRRQMLKHVRGSRDHHDSPHIWPNA